MSLVGGGQDAVTLGLLPQMATESMQELAAREWPRRQRRHEGRDPRVVVDELVLVDEGVVDTIDVVCLEVLVVDTMRSEEVPAASGLVQVVIQVGSGRDDAIDEAVSDQMRDDETHPGGAQGSRHPEEDHHVVAQHLLPDPAGHGEVPPLEGDALHAGQHLVGSEPGVHAERLDR